MVTIKASFILILSWVSAFLLFPGTDPELEKILDRTEAYCNKLNAFVFHCACTETIAETVQLSLDYSRKNKILQDFSFNENSVDLSRKFQCISTTYTSQYQLLRKGDQITEFRLVLEENGKKVQKENPHLQTLIYSRNAFLAPMLLFAAGVRQNYSYKLLRKEKMLETEAYVIEVRLKDSTAAKDIFAVAWIDSNDSSILKFEAFPRTLNGYDYLARIANENIEELYVKDVHYFECLNEGMRFPSRTEISLSFKNMPQKGNKYSLGVCQVTRINTQFSYRDYQFFKVSVDSVIIK